MAKIYVTYVDVIAELDVEVIAVSDVVVVSHTGKNNQVPRALSTLAIKAAED